MIDWSAKNEIVALLDEKLVTWMLFTDKTIAYMLNTTKAVAFDKTGNQLAIGMRYKDQAVIQLWNTSRLDKRYLVHTHYLKRNATLWYDEVISLTWDSKHLLFCGTNQGKIFIFDTIKRIVTHVIPDEHAPRPIIEVRFNSKYQYFASCDGSYLILWYWDGINLTAHSCTKKRNKITFDFHPWNPNKIVVAECEPPRLAIMDIPSRTATAAHRHIRGSNANVSINSVSFNRTTGELVVSIWNKATKVSELLVLGGIDWVVDILRGHEKKVAFMLWSPNGKILGKIYI